MRRTVWATVLVAALAIPAARATVVGDTTQLQTSTSTGTQDLARLRGALYDFYLQFGDCTQVQFCEEGGYQMPQRGGACSYTCADSQTAVATIRPDGTWCVAMAPSDALDLRRVFVTQRRSVSTLVFVIEASCQSTLWLIEPAPRRCVWGLVLVYVPASRSSRGLASVGLL